LAAINSGSNLLHAVFGAQMALILGSGILSEATVRRTVARRMPVGEVYAGEPAPVRVELDNIDRRIDVLSVSVEDDDRIDHEGRCAPVFAVRLAAAATLTLPATVTMDRRGRHELPRAVVATRFPFGLFVKRRELPAGAPVLVYPRVHPVVVPEDESPHSGTGEAPRRRARVGEFFGLREFRDGDDLRRMHWPAYARTGRPFVREHEADGDREVVLILAPGRTGHAAFEADVERCASQAVALLREGGVAVGLRIGGELVVPPASGDEQRRRVLGTLAVCGEASA
jgi:uncharacterized protein (DUF58 family)